MADSPSKRDDEFDGSDSGLDAPGASEFIKKLYQMVDDHHNAKTGLAMWSQDGAAFMVDKTSKFPHEVLPSYFKHNNYSSFVRQLNKYRFHKVKLSQEAIDDSMSEFQHPFFKQGQLQQLANVKRKGQPGALPRTSTRPMPPKRKRERTVQSPGLFDSASRSPTLGQPPSMSSQQPSMMSMPMSMSHMPMSGNLGNPMPAGHSSTSIMSMMPSFVNFMPSQVTQTSMNPLDDLQGQIDNLTKLQSDMASYLQTLSKNYHVVVEEILSFRQSMTHQDQVIRNLVEYLVSRDAGMS